MPEDILSHKTLKISKFHHIRSLVQEIEALTLQKF